MFETRVQVPPLLQGLLRQALSETATSQKEWQFVVDPAAGGEYVERGGTFREEHPEWCRKPTPLSVYIKVMEIDIRLLSSQCLKHLRGVSKTRRENARLLELRRDLEKIYLEDLRRKEASEDPET